MLSLRYMRSVQEWAAQRSYPVHLDGARAFNAAAALGELLQPRTPPSPLLALRLAQPRIRCPMQLVPCPPNPQLFTFHPVICLRFILQTAEATCAIGLVPSAGVSIRDVMDTVTTATFCLSKVIHFRSIMPDCAAMTAHAARANGATDEPATCDDRV